MIQALARALADIMVVVVCLMYSPRLRTVGRDRIETIKMQVEFHPQRPRLPSVSIYLAMLVCRCPSSTVRPETSTELGPKCQFLQMLASFVRIQSPGFPELYQP